MPIGPVSSTGRAMMASLQQAMSKGMPVDQAIAYVKGMATQGVAPMTDLYAMLNQFQRLKQPKVQAPQVPPTLKDQLGQLSQAQDVIEQGVGSLPAPAMERAQFAGGGIIGFIEGGATNDPFRPDPNIERQIRDQAGLAGDAVEDFRRGIGTLGNDVYSRASGWDPATQDMQRKWDASSVPEGIRSGLVAPPPGLPTNTDGHDVRLYPPEGGWQGMAAGGIVAFDEGGLAIDFSKMTLEELDQLTNDPNPEVMSRARKELVGRFTSSPGDILSKYASAVRGGIEGPPAIRFSNERKFPSYMYDEKGNVRKGEVTGGIAGTRFYSSSNPPEKQGAAPTAAPAASSQLPPSATFDDMMSRARTSTDQTGTPYDLRKTTEDTGKGKKKGADTSEAGYKDLESLIPKEGSIAEYLAEVRKARGENAAAQEYKKYLDRLEAGGAQQDERSRNLAIAKAGFAMAEAASRRGSKRTGLLGAAAIGGSEFAAGQERIMQQMQARQEKLAEARFKLADAQRREDTDDIRAAMQEVKANQRAIAQAKSDITRLRIAEEGQTTRANIAARSQELLADRYAQQAEAAARSGDLKSLAQLQAGILAELKDPFTQEADKAQLRGLLGQIRGRLAGSLTGGPMTTGPQLGAMPDNIAALVNKYR